MPVFLVRRCTFIGSKCCLFHSSYHNPSGQENGGIVPLIVGGEQTTIERFPWIVSLQRLGIHFCGGSIISTTRILSAAHCTFGIPATSISIRAGSTNNMVGGQFIGVSQVHNHPQYSSFDNDICVVVINTPLNLAPAGVAIVAMPVQGAGVPVGGKIINATLRSGNTAAVLNKFCS